MAIGTSPTTRIARSTSKRAQEIPERYNRRNTDGGVLQRDEWLVGRGYLSAESVSLVLTGQSLDIHTEIKEETAQLQAA